MDEMEKQYLKHQGKYLIEREILSWMNKHELQNLIHNKEKESQELTQTLKKLLKELMKKPYYEFLPEISKFFLERTIFEFHWWSEIMQMNSTIKNWKYLLQLKYENKRNPSVLSREKILKVKQIPIERLVERFTWIKTWQRWNIRCPFHDDSTGSLKIYQQTNSFYCFGCQKWGTPIEFTAGYLNISNKEAIKELSKFIY